ncbi:MAG TPA: hypothetical protein VFD09_10305 [Thiopseudomonas sp.]|nr:hypothetical protein [Thiopseudomonas sp.]
MKQITKRSVKLYQGLAPKQLAALTLQSMADMNAEEVDKIRSAVVWREYRCIDTAYTDWRDAFHSVVLVWTAEFWRQCFLYASTLSRLQSLTRLDAGQPDDAFDSTHEQLQQCVARQLAHSKVLYDLCNEHGFEYNAVLKLAGVPDRYNPLDDGDIDEAFYQQWYDDLSECLPSA